MLGNQYLGFSKTEVDHRLRTPRQARQTRQTRRETRPESRAYHAGAPGVPFVTDLERATAEMADVAGPLSKALSLSDALSPSKGRRHWQVVPITALKPIVTEGRPQSRELRRRPWTARYAPVSACRWPSANRNAYCEVCQGP